MIVLLVIQDHKPEMRDLPDDKKAHDSDNDR